jgi:hypothetical protein
MICQGIAAMEGHDDIRQDFRRMVFYVAEFKFKISIPVFFRKSVAVIHDFFF